MAPSKTKRKDKMATSECLSPDEDEELDMLVFRAATDLPFSNAEANRLGELADRANACGATPLPGVTGVTDRPNSLPEDADARNSYPMADGLLDYFPNALAEVSKVSFIGNQQHNPGEPMHWARGKSTDHRNKIARHLIDAGGKDSKGVRHSAYLAWRALANLQEELERDEGYPVSRGSA